MKRAIVATVIGLAASVATSFAQGTFSFDSYTGTAPNVTYGAGVAGHAQGSDLASGFTAWLYINPGGTNQTLIDVTGNGDPSALSGAWVLATGPNTVALQTTAFGYPDLFQAPGLTEIDQAAIGAGVSLIMAVGDGSSYANSAIRGHSIAFGAVLGGGTTLPQALYNVAAGLDFGVTTVVPEPTTFALVGLGAAALMIIRRRK